MYTFLDFAVYLRCKTQDLFFERKCTLWYQIIATLPTRLREFFFVFFYSILSETFFKSIYMLCSVCV